MASPTVDHIFQKIKQTAQNFPGAKFLSEKQQAALTKIWLRRESRDNEKPSTGRKQQEYECKYLRFLDKLYLVTPLIHWLCVIAGVAKQVGRLRNEQRQELINLLVQGNTREPFNSESLHSWRVEDSLSASTLQHTGVQKSDIPKRNHSLDDVQNHYVRWFGPDIATYFGEKVAALTKCSVDRRITMAFPKGNLKDCFISFPLEVDIAKSLINSWFGFELTVLKDGKLRIMKNGIIIAAPGDLVFSGVTEKDIYQVLGPRMLQHIADSKLRELESSEGILQTACLSVSVSVSPSSVSPSSVSSSSVSSTSVLSTSVSVSVPSSSVLSTSVSVSVPSSDCMLNVLIGLVPATTILAKMSPRQ